MADKDDIYGEPGLIVLEPEHFEALLREVEREPRPNPRLAALMALQKPVVTIEGEEA